MLKASVTLSVDASKRALWTDILENLHPYPAPYTRVGSGGTSGEQAAPPDAAAVAGLVVLSAARDEHVPDLGLAQPHGRRRHRNRAF